MQLTFFSAYLCRRVVVMSSGCVLCWWDDSPPFPVLCYVRQSANRQWCTGCSSCKWDVGNFATLRADFLWAAPSLWMNLWLEEQVGVARISLPFAFSPPGDEWCSSSYEEHTMKVGRSFGQAFKFRCQLSVLGHCLTFLPYYVWKWVSCLLSHSICLEIFRCLVIILIFLTHVKCAHLIYHSCKASKI